MNLACIHTHTVFCDGEDDIETCCRAACRKGLRSVGFSAHAPLPPGAGFSSAWHLPGERLSEYLESVRAARKRWEGKLPVYLGLELDYIPGVMGPADGDYRELGLDYIIGAVHYVVPPKGRPFEVDGSRDAVIRGIREGFGGDPMEMVNCYYNALEAMIRAGGFDLLAHPDLVKKNRLPAGAAESFPGEELFSEDDVRCRERTAVIAGLLAEAGVPAEINTGGMNRGKIKDCYPSRNFLERFREKGVPMVINADAHRAEDLDGHYEDAVRALLEAGYSETVVFEGRVNGRPVWKREKL